MQKDIFDAVKEQLGNKGITNRSMVADVLGEPVLISGADNVYHSPFFAGDNEPSFMVSDEFISDFSDGSDFGKGKDIFNFIVAYNDVTHFISNDSITDFEALKWVVDKYKLNVDISSLPYVSSKSKKVELPHLTYETKVEYTFQKSEKKPEKVWAMFDTEMYKQKPKDESGKIKNRIKDLPFIQYTYEEITQAFENGRTCIPGGIKSEKDWQDGVSKQQIFMIDIDNAEKINGEKVVYKLGDEKHVTLEKLLEFCDEKQLRPTCVYKTFSYTDEQNKFRVVFILDKPVTSKKEVEHIYQYLTSNFKELNVDTAPTSPASMFFGGTEVVYNSNAFYSFEKNEKKFVNTDAIDTYNEMLKYTPYVIHNRQLCYKKQSSKKGKKGTIDSGSETVAEVGTEPNVDDNTTYVPLSNFLVIVDKKHIFDNGNDAYTYYQVNCILLDNPFVKLLPQIIDAKTFASGNYILGSIWDKYAIVNSGRGNADRIREVTQILSRNFMQEEMIYAHTGFRRINNKLCYLYDGGIIGNVQNVNVDLSKDGLECYKFTDIKCANKNEEYNEIVKAIKLSYSVLNVADYSITVPLIATAYLAPLYSLLSEENILADYVVFVQGKSGTRKSSLSAVILSHFGIFNRDNFPCNFRDTLNSLEKKAYIAKDTLLVIDDYNPEIFGNGKLFTAEKIFGMFGDRIGRGRMMADGSGLKKAYTARGLAIMTGETFPEVAQSRVARCLIINIEQDSIDLEKLANIQDNVALLSLAMRKFIELIIEIEPKIRKEIKDKFREFSASKLASHGRTNEMTAIMKIGFYLFAEFLKKYRIVDDTEYDKLLAYGYKTLDDLAIQQSAKVNELKPTEMFFNAFEELLSSEKIYVDSTQKRGFQDTTFPASTPFCELAGYYDEDKKVYYLYPKIIFSQIEQHYRGLNQKFPINANSLWKYLEEEGYLYRTDKSRYTVQRRIHGKDRSVIELRIPDKEEPFKDMF